MEKYLSFLATLPLFRGMQEMDILHLLHNMDAKEMYFAKQEIVWDAMRSIPYMCIVVEGSFMILQEDWRGNRSIIGSFCRGDFLCEGIIGAAEGVLPFYLSVKAGTRAITFTSEDREDPLNGQRAVHWIFLRNLVDVLLQKEMRLLYKIESLSRRTTRDKLMSYLTIQSARQGSRTVTVDYTRQELADFLSVDRSAMCTELTRMQNDGLIRYARREFELLPAEKGSD